jgi:hypothetical protein
MGHTTPNNHAGGFSLDFTFGIFLRDTKYPETKPKIIGEPNKILDTVFFDIFIRQGRGVAYSIMCI